MYQQRMGYALRCDKNSAYKSIREIVLNKSFKNEAFYIKLFGENFNNWSFRKKCSSLCLENPQ